MEIVSIQKNIHTSPRKLRLVADMVRKMDPNRSLQVLRLTNKAAARPLLKAIQTALANARERKLDESGLSFKNLEINEGMAMKRYRAGTRGRIKPYKKRTSHIKIVLTDDLEVKSQKSKVKNMESAEKVAIVEQEEGENSQIGNKTGK